MSFGLVIERREGTGNRISLEEWKALVSSRNDLQIRSAPYVAVNPSTQQQITLPVGEGDSEVLIDGQWLPFLRFRRGALITEYDEEFETPSNPIRIAIAQISKELGAVIGTDLGDDVFEW